MKTLAIGMTVGAALSAEYHGVFKTAKNRAVALRSEYKNLGKQEQALASFIKYGAKLDSLKAKQAKLGGSSDRLNRGIADLQQRYNSAKREVKGYGISVGDAVAQHKRLSAQAAKTHKRLQRIDTMRAKGQQLSNMRGQAAAGIGAAVALAAPIREAVEFESVMADVKKVVNFDSPAKFKTMGKDILRMSGEIPLAASGLAEIMAAAGQSGIARGELLAFTKDAAKMGVAFDLTGGEAGQMMANWRAGMNLTQGQVVSLADAVNHLSNNMNAQAPDLGEVIKRQGAVAMAAGLAETEVAALGAALLSSGAAPSIAATAMKNLTGALSKGEAATKSQRTAMQALGLDAVELSENMQMDAKGTILDVFKALEQVEPAARGGLVSQLFGEESKGAIAPLLKNLGNLENAFDQVAHKSKFAGSMQAEYDERSKTTENNLQLLKNKFSRLGVTIGSAFLPAVNVAVDGLGMFINAASWLFEKVPGLAIVIGGLATGVAVFATGLGAVTAAQWLWNAALLANPIGAVVAGVVGLGVAIFGLIKNWQEVKETALDFWAMLEKKVPWVTGIMKVAFAPLIGLIKGVGWVWDKIAGGDPSAAASGAGKAVGGAAKAGVVAAAVATGTPSFANDASPSLGAQASGANSIQNHFQIQSLPGQDEEAIADMVIKKQEEAQRQAQTRGAR